MADKHVLVQRDSKVFGSQNNWTYWCSCDSTTSRQLSSLHGSVNMEFSEFCRRFPDCCHVAAAKSLLQHFDDENEISPLDEVSDGDHRYANVDEIFEVPGAEMVVCRSRQAGRFGLVSSRFVCSTCRSNHCEHVSFVRHEASLGNPATQSFTVTDSNDSSTPRDRKKLIISSQQISFQRSDEVTRKLKALQHEDTCRDLIPEETNCPHCKSSLAEGDPIEEGWVAYENAVLVTNTAVRHVRVYYRPCTSCDHVAVFEGNSKGILNMGTYLVGHDVLRSYMHSFLHGRRPLYTFYQCWCDVHLDYGNAAIQVDMPYQKLLRAWHAFLGLLDVDLTEGFTCPDCGDGPDTIVCDGTSLAFQRRMWRWSEEEGKEEMKDLVKTKFSDRVFIADVGTRNLLKRYTLSRKSVRGATKVKPLDSLEERQLKVQLLSVSKPLYNILQEIDGDPALFAIYQKLLFSLASPSPVSSFIRPTKVVENLVSSILSGAVIKEEPILWAELHTSMPIVFDIFERHEVTDNMKFLIGELWNIAMFTYVNASADIDNDCADIDLSQPNDELAFFPNLPKIRKRRKYTFDKNVKKSSKDICTKRTSGHPSLLPGVFTIFCPHGVCYGFQVMQCNESPNTPFTILRTRFKKAPKHVIYDNACKLHDYCLNRDPLFFKETQFCVDRLHWDNHTSCSYGYELSSYPQFDSLNSQCNEQANAGLKRIKDQLSYMTANNFMFHCSFYLWNMNMKKLKQFN